MENLCRANTVKLENLTQMDGLVLFYKKSHTVNHVLIFKMNGVNVRS